MKTFLHVGCGPQNKSRLKGFSSDEWREIRFDIDPSVHPDIEGTLTDMQAVTTGSVDAIYSSHNIEHVFPHEVHTVLLEFHRVLKHDGIVVLTCPDLISVCQAVVKDRLMETLYESPAGPIAPIDVVYGHRDSVAKGKIHMAHKTGFTYSTLNDAFFKAGFKFNVGAARPSCYDLWIVSFKQPMSNEEGTEIAKNYLP
ncbi:MAG: methyltransferase domain-containing protein [Steroidobacteraceae bacterium]|jgi:SAM-dependent methyltransferase